MGKLKSIMLIVLLAADIILCQTKYFRFENYSITSGLSNISINCILQTRDGFLWIATKDGLNRFDGQNFKVYKNNPALIHSLPENYVMSLLESKDGTLWIGTWGGGLSWFDKSTEKFYRTDLTYADDDYVQFLYEDFSHNIWYGTLSGGLNKFNPSLKKITTYRKENISPYFFPDNEITWISEDSAKNIWASTTHAGLVKLNPFSNQIENYRQSQNLKNSLSSDFVLSIFNDGNKFFLIGTSAGIDKFSLKDFSFQHNPSIPHNLNADLNVSIKHILKDHNGNLWIGTYDYLGLYFIENPFSPNQKIEHIILDDNDPHSLISNRIRWLYEDRNYNLWIGTEEGISKLPRQNHFTQFRYLPGTPNSLSEKVVSGIVTTDNNTLWVSYGGGGFDKINLLNGAVKHFTYNPNNPNSLTNADIVSLYLDREGFLWAGTMVGGLSRFDTLTNNFKNYRFRPNHKYSLKSDWVQQVLETSNGLFLVGTNEGLQVLDRTNNLFYDFQANTKIGSEKIPSNISVNSLFEDRDGNIYIGTWLSGLYVFNKAENYIYHFMPEEGNTASISSSKIIFIQQDSNGFIWLGTHSGGLNRFDPASKKFKRFTTHNGLPNDVVFGIQEDKSGFLWISTLNGLAKFDSQKQTFIIYDQADGLISNTFNWRASNKDKNGRLYFGGVFGFVSFNPDEILTEENYSPIAFTSFKLFDKEAVLPLSLPTTKEIELSYDNNFFSIEFIALDLAPAHKHKYKYKLEGIDKDWIDSENRNTAFYTDIDPGEYKFVVKAGNADNVWTNTSSIIIRITPAWWMTWWFKLFIALVILLIAYLLYKIRIDQLIKIERIRYEIASDLHDEIGSNLSSISVDGQLLMKNESIAPPEKELISDISKTAAQTLDAMRDIVWFINPKNDANEDIIFKMKETAAKLLGGIQWSFQIIGEPRLENFSLEQRRNIFLIYKESLTNVARHSKADKCEIELEGISSQIRLSIRDNGIGFEKNNVKMDTGFFSLRNRANKVNALLEINSEIQKGTEIKLIAEAAKNK